MMYQRTPDKCLAELGSGLEGLTTSEVRKRQNKFGKNELIQKTKKPGWKLFLAQFKDFMIMILLLSAMISGLLGSITDSIVILFIVLANAVIGFIQEYKAGKAIDALKSMDIHTSFVKRDGQWLELPSVELVPGDIVQLDAGKNATADLRLLEAHALRMDESALTGESEPVDKTVDALVGGNRSPADQTNMAFKGTFITNGRGVGLVVGTGMNTELGKIAGLLQDEEMLTPLQVRMKKFSQNLSYIILGICTVMLLVGLYRGEGLMPMVLIAISLAVAAIPEALPALITVALANGAARMAGHHALIRKLPSVETLGSVDYICTDKTGTLTENNMQVVKVDSTGLLISDDSIPVMQLAMVLNHDVRTTQGEVLVGDPTEVAIVNRVVEDLGREEYSRLTSMYPRIREFPFDSDRKRMTTIHGMGSRFLVITKGAPEAISQCLSPSEDPSRLLKLTADWASAGQRTMAFGFRFLDRSDPDISSKEIEKDLQLCGLIGMIDPPVSDVVSSVEECRKAGITLVMITGDHPATAMAIAGEIGIYRPGDLTLTGADLGQLSELDFTNQVEKTTVYSRVSPVQKLQIIKALQAKGHCVSMTGDGINDAPSLRSANIGVAMGKRGTDVAREASHLILLDDRFKTIVVAVKEGRRIYDNILKFIVYIMSCNGAEVLTLFIGPLLGLPMPLLPIHILWINLVTDGLPGLALANEKAEKDVMLRLPRKENEGIFSNGIGLRILWSAILMALVTLGVQAWSIATGHGHWQTMVFTVLSMSQLGNALASSSHREQIWKRGILSNKLLFWTLIATIGLQMAVIYVPALNVVFRTKPLTWSELAICFGLSAIVFHMVELSKWTQVFYESRTSENQAASG